MEEGGWHLHLITAPASPGEQRATGTTRDPEDRSSRKRQQRSQSVVVALPVTIAVVVAVTVALMGPGSAKRELPASEPSRGCGAGSASTGQKPATATTPVDLKAGPVRADPRISEDGDARDGEWASWHENSEQRPGRNRLYAAEGLGEPFVVDLRADSYDGDPSRQMMVYSIGSSPDGSDLVWYDLARDR